MGDSSTDFHYFAFISYKREDEKWAKWLQRKIENYKLPASIAKAHNLPKRLRPVFRDKTDIQPNILKDEIIERLDASQYLIVICSPRSVRSNWVGFGIDHFVSTGKRDKIIAFIVDGEPYSNNEATECYHPHLRQFFPRSENPHDDKQLLGVNVNEKGKENRFHKRERAVIQVISKMLDVSFDLLWSRAKRKNIKTVLIVTAGVLLAIACVITGALQYQKMTAPFDVTFSFYEKHPNAHLPHFENAHISVTIDDIKHEGTIKTIGECLKLSNVSRSLAGAPARVTLSCQGYQPLDTIVSLADSHQLELKRDPNIYGYVCATVVDLETDDPLPNTEIYIGPQTVITDGAGFFRTSIPLDQQRTKYSLSSNDLILETDVISVPCAGYEVIYARQKK